MKKFLIALFITLISSRASLAENNTRAKISGNLRDAFAIHFSTPEGIHSFKFNKIDARKFLATESDSDGIFFKGKQTRATIDGNTPLASADIIDNLLTINFRGRRSGRPFVLTLDLGEADNDGKPGRLAHVSSSLDLGCATAESIETQARMLIPHATSKPALRELTVSVDADNSFFNSFKTIKTRKAKAKLIANRRKKALDSIRQTFNTVNAIYTEQLGIVVVLADVKVDSANERSIAEKNAENLLNFFRINIKKLNYLVKADIYHLFTANKMSGSVVGLAYVGITCRKDLSEYSVGLSRLTNPAVQPLITAHEIAHNLGATHLDGDNSIMSPVLTGSKTKFIPMSINQIMGYVSDFGVCISEVLGNN